ncbi:MAG TPA: hypothetical protein GXZ58_04505 [Bacilli bacterium]|nr:hypothetical protein [Bacilli bacterium]
MKKLLRYLVNDQTGTTFVYLFYLSTIILLFTIAIITQLENEQKISRLEIEQLQLNMIHQQTYQTIINDWDQIDHSETYTYVYPNGRAKVSFKLDNEAFYKMTITATREAPYQKIKTYQLELSQNN